jgi:DNA processing protein
MLSLPNGVDGTAGETGRTDQESNAEKSACIILNSAGLTLRRLGEDSIRSCALLEPARLPGDLVVTAGERARIEELSVSDFIPREMERARKLGFTILTPLSPEYPELLRQIADPPLAIYVQGDPGILSRPAVAVVGSRNATAYGRTAAETLAAGLAARGYTVVSGFARGIDAAAHRAAVKTGGKTVAVLGCGGDIDYPKGHAELRDEILKSGCMVTEFPFGTEPEKHTFPRRNRIISGLALGVVVVEAMERSGALITARHAMEQNREVFAVPGGIFSPGSFGPNRLIRDGAKLVETVDDIVEELTGQLALPLPPVGEAPVGEAPVGEEAKVYSALSSEPVYVDDLGTRVGLPIARLLSVLSLLELKRLARQHPGKRFSR